MKHITTYEETNFGIEEVIEEINITEKIVDFLNKYGLHEIQVERPGYTNGLFLVFSKKYDCLMKIVDGEEEDVMFGIFRYEGVNTYTDILNFLENMTQNEIDVALAKQESKKYNL